METVTDFIFLASKFTADGDCSHKIKRCLLFGKKAITNLKSRDITLLTKVHIVKAIVFPYRCVWGAVHENGVFCLKDTALGAASVLEGLLVNIALCPATPEIRRLFTIGT